MIVGPRSDPADARAADDVARDQAGDAARLGLVGCRVQRGDRRACASDLVDIVDGGSDSHVCVPMQGSGTFSVEAAINTLVPRDGHVLVPINGAYGTRIVRISRDDGPRGRRRSRTPTTSDHGRDDVEAAARGRSVDHARRRRSTARPSTGMLNSARRRSRRSCARHRQESDRRRDELVRARCRSTRARRRSTRWSQRRGKCVEGPPGMGFVIVRRGVLEALRRQRRTSLALDLHDQWTLHGEDDAVALHAADARRRRVARRARPVRGRGRPAGAARALPRNCETLIARHGGAGLPPVPRSPRSRRRSSSPSMRRPTRATTSRRFYERRARHAASSCIRAS